MVAMMNRNLEAQRQSLREAMMQLQPPNSDEILRTIFIGGLTEEGVGHNNAETERVLAAVGGLRRWIRPTDSSGRPCRFGFAEYEDPESLKTAVEVLKGLEVPVKREEQASHNSEKENKEANNEEQKNEGENGDVDDSEKSKLLVCITQLEFSRGTQTLTWTLTADRLWLTRRHKNIFATGRRIAIKIHLLSKQDFKPQNQPSMPSLLHS